MFFGTETNGVDIIDNGIVIYNNGNKRKMGFDEGTIVDIETVELDTSFYGATVYKEVNYDTPFGILKYTYRAHGAALEHINESWDFITSDEKEIIIKKIKKLTEEINELTKSIKV